jgi:hypothetical protein
MVSVLTFGSKVCGLKSGQGDGFVRELKIRSTPSFQMGSKIVGPHLVRCYGILKITSKCEQRCLEGFYYLLR